MSLLWWIELLLPQAILLILLVGGNYHKVEEKSRHNISPVYSRAELERDRMDDWDRQFRELDG